MAQAKLDVPEKSGGGVKEKDKDSEEKEGTCRMLYSSVNHCVLSFGKLYFIGCVLFGVFTTLVKLFILVYQILKTNAHEHHFQIDRTHNMSDNISVVLDKKKIYTITIYITLYYMCKCI